MSAWHRHAARAIESILLATGLSSFIASRRGRTRAILAFHNVCDPRDAAIGDASLHMPTDVFGDLIETLQKHADIVPLKDLLATSSRTRANRISITFDDAYSGAISNGLTTLGELRCSSTVFVAPGLLGEPSTWWDEAATQPNLAMSDARREAWLDGECAGLSAAIRAEHANWQRPPLPESFAIASADALLDAAKRFEVVLASHTWSHVNVATLAEASMSSADAYDQLESELRRPQEWLLAQGVRIENTLAYPYGRWSELATRAARTAGYEAALRVDGGAIAEGQRDFNMFAIPRINVPSMMRAGGVFARVSGLRA